MVLAGGAAALVVSDDSPLRVVGAVLCAGLAISLLSAVSKLRAEVIDRPSDWMLQRELMRCRRRGESAYVLVMEMTARAAEVERVLGTLRLTDTVMVKRIRGGARIQGILEAEGLDRLRLQQRLWEASDKASIGWASFPEDGLTLEVLVEHAARAAASGRALERPSSAYSPGVAGSPAQAARAMTSAATQEG
jgi:hypothetical protein